MGGVRNALERGETLTKAKQSFLNAGYTEPEIQSAVQRMSASGVQIAKPLIQPSPQLGSPPQPDSPPQAVAPQIQPSQEQQSSTGLMVVLLVIGVLILLSALLLGLFWDKIIPFWDKLF